VARKQKAANSEATTFGIVTAPKRKRGKADSNIEERYQRAQEEEEAGFVETVRPLKRLATGEIVMPMFEPTPEQQKKTEEYYQNLKNEKKRLQAQCRIDRDKALAAIGIDHDEDQHLIEKVIEA